MSIFTKSATAALTVLALGTAVLATTSAEASPRHGRHGGWGHGHHGGHWGGPWGGHGGHWGHGGWGRPVVHGGPLLGSHCRIVIRYDVYGDPIGRRRICYPRY